jgi:excinuclease UvrABC ATPase subunit
MIHDRIIVRNAHANNLKNIDIEIPKHNLVVFTGVSGSGKSSLLFDTIYTEARRQLIETFSTFARTRMPKLSRPDVDDIQNLSTAIVIDQKRMGNNLRSTVGTATEINTYLRLLYSRIGKPFIGPSFYFSFNHPEGMCPQCRGLGKNVRIDLDKFIDREKTIREGAITHPHYKIGGYLWREMMTMELFDVDKKLKDFSAQELTKLLYAEPFAVTNAKQKLTYSKNFEGIVRKLEKAAFAKADDELPEEEKNAYSKYFLYAECTTCGGRRLNERAGSVTIHGVTIADLCRMELTDAVEFMTAIKEPVAAPILRKAQFLTRQLIEIGVGYLSLDRSVSTLSGGESQRVKMARQLDCNLVDLLYVLDEPTIGLHPRDTEKLLAILFRLMEKGNSVFVVEHDPDVIKAAQWIVDMGPGAGKYGGAVVYSGAPEGLGATGSITGAYLRDSEKKIFKRKTPKEFIVIRNASAHNLKNITVKIPKNALTCITGVAGSGKSSLVHECLLPLYPEAILIDQMPIGRSSRANPATYIGVFDLIRKEFAAATGSDPSLFSFNSKGACTKCNGQGMLSFDMHFLDAVKTVCDECEGKRYRGDVLDLKMEGNNIAEVLDLSIDSAMEFFKPPAIRRHFKLLQDVGLGYLKTGQSLSSLSGGESQRLKIAAELSKKSNMYVMDEPTTGLHRSDIENFFRIITTLVDHDNTVIIIEHNLDIIKYADWIIDLGPGGGKDGGEVIFEGTPEGLMDEPKSYTGIYLKKTGSLGT